MAVKININLSDKTSFSEAINKLKSLKFGTDFDNKMVNNLVDTCYDKCFENLELMKIYENTQFREVKKSITKTSASNGEGSVNIGYPAIMVEFGMGTMGVKTRDADEMSRVRFSDVHDSSDGWVYITDEGASNPKKKYNAKTGEWTAWTWGQPSRPFGYLSSLYIREIAKEEVKRAIKAKMK